MHVTAVVVCWNSAADLPRCLDALLAQDHPALSVVVVDNASTDDSGAVLRRYRDRGVHTVWNTSNRGFAGGVNDALALTDGDAVLLCNPDAAPRPDHVRLLVEALAADARRGAVQGKLLRPAPSPSGDPVIDATGHRAFRTRLFRNRGEGEIDRGQYETPGPVFGVTGALALYRRAMLEDVALRQGDHRRPQVLAEDLFAYFEDVDLDWRAAMRGWTAWYEPRAVATHERGGAGARRTPVVEQLNFVNRLLVIVACDDGRSLLGAAPSVLLTTTLKAVELLVTVPSAFVGAVRRLPGGLRAALRRRALVQAHATVPSADVVRRWFEPFDYRAWVRAWWRRIRRVPPGV